MEIILIGDVVDRLKEDNVVRIEDKASIGRQLDFGERVPVYVVKRWSKYGTLRNSRGNRDSR